MNSFVYTSAIKKLRKLNKRIKVIPGGTSAGKTYGIIPILIDKAIKNPNSEISIVSESVPHLRRGAMKDFEKIMKTTNRWNDKSFSRTLLKYTFFNGSYIEFFGTDQADKLRGARRTELYINEANNVTFEVYQQLSIRTSESVWIDFNPSNEFWAHTELDSDNDAEWLTLTYKDNEALPVSIIREIEKAKEKALTSSYWDNWWKVYGLGQLGVLEGVIFNNWSIIDEVSKDAKYIGTGLDYGYTNDPTAATDKYIYNGKRIYDEIIYQKGLLNSEIANLLKGFRRKVVAESAEPKSNAELKMYGIDVIPAVKGKDSINFGIQIMQEDDFFVTKRSVNLINELRKYSWDKDRSGNTLNIPIDNYNHAIDGIRYLESYDKNKPQNIRRGGRPMQGSRLRG